MAEPFRNNFWIIFTKNRCMMPTAVKHTPVFDITFLASQLLLETQPLGSEPFPKASINDYENALLLQISWEIWKSRANNNLPSA